MKNASGMVLLIGLLMALAFGPVVSAGYADISAADSAPSAHERSILFESAAHRLPWAGNLYEAAGSAALEAKEYQRALGLFQAAASRGTLSPRGRFDFGSAYFFADDEAHAIVAWEALTQGVHSAGSPEAQADISASRSLAILYHMRGRFDDEARALRHWLALDPHSVEAQYPLGLLLFADASPQAVSLLDAVASASPTLRSTADSLSLALTAALANLSAAGRLTACGQTLASLGEWSLALRSFSRAVETDPHHALAWAWLGEARQQTGNGDPLAAFQRAVALAPQAAEIHGMFGLYWQHQHQWQAARDEFKIAAGLEPQRAVWQMSLGQAFVGLGDLVTALAYYQNAVVMAPRDPQTWRALALFSVENNVDVEGTGRAAALRAYALDSANAETLDILGRTLMATEQWDAAESFFKKALQAAPANAAPAYHLGLLYLQTQQLDLAKQYLQSAQALDPNGPIGSQAAGVLARYFP